MNLIQLIIDALAGTDLVTKIGEENIGRWIVERKQFADSIQVGSYIGSHEGIHQYPEVIQFAESQGFNAGPWHRDDPDIGGVFEDAIEFMNKYFADEGYSWDLNEHTLDFGYWKNIEEIYGVVMAAGPEKDLVLVKSDIEQYGVADSVSVTNIEYTGEVLIVNLHLWTDDRGKTLQSIHDTLELLGYFHILFSIDEQE